MTARELIDLAGRHPVALLVLIAATFVILLALRRTWIGIVFAGSIVKLFVLGAALFALLKWGAHALARRRGEERVEPSSFPKL